MRSILALSAGFASHRCHNLAPTWSGHSKIRKGYRRKKKRRKCNVVFCFDIELSRIALRRTGAPHLPASFMWSLSQKPGLIVTLNERGRNGPKVGDQTNAAR